MSSDIAKEIVTRSPAGSRAVRCQRGTRSRAVSYAQHSRQWIRARSGPESPARCPPRASALRISSCIRLNEREASIKRAGNAAVLYAWAGVHVKILQVRMYEHIPYEHIPVSTVVHIPEWVEDHFVDLRVLRVENLSKLHMWVLVFINTSNCND